MHDTPTKTGGAGRDRQPFSPINKATSVFRPFLHQNVEVNNSATPTKKCKDITRSAKKAKQNTLLSPSKLHSKAPTLASVTSPTKSLFSPIGNKRRSQAAFDVAPPSPPPANTLGASVTDWACGLRGGPPPPASSDGHKQHANRAPPSTVAETPDGRGVSGLIQRFEGASGSPLERFEQQGCPQGRFGGTTLAFQSFPPASAAAPNLAAPRLRTAARLIAASLVASLAAVTSFASACGKGGHCDIFARPLPPRNACPLSAASPLYGAPPPRSPSSFSEEEVIYAGGVTKGAGGGAATALLTADGEVYFYSEGDAAAYPYHLSPCSLLQNPTGGFRSDQPLCSVLPLVDVTSGAPTPSDTAHREHLVCSASRGDNLRLALALHKASRSVAEGSLGYSCEGGRVKGTVAGLLDRIFHSHFEGYSSS